MLNSINWPNLIVWLSLPLEILYNVCIAIIYCPVCDVKTLEINRSFLIKPFFCITKKSGQKFKNLKNGKIGELQSRKAAKNCAKKSNLNKIFQNF